MKKGIVAINGGKDVQELCSNNSNFSAGEASVEGVGVVELLRQIDSEHISPIDWSDFRILDLAKPDKQKREGR